MSIERLPETISTLYAELLEQALVLERSSGIDASLPGGVVGKEVKGRRYLYWQMRRGGTVTQRYLGPDTAELRAALDRLAERRRDADEVHASLDRLAAMLVAGGAAREPARVAGVLRMLADIGLFRRGGVLVGTQAFRTYGAVLGVRLPATSVRTQDTDVAHSIDVAVAAADEDAPALDAGLAALGFLAVPGLDPCNASTSYHLRRGELRVDFLTPARRRGEQAPVRIPGLGFAAWPLPFLDYLIEDPVPAITFGTGAVLVKIPRPARFALHKLWTAASRPVSEQTKAGKDRTQAATLIEVLADDRPDDLREALAALAARPAAKRKVAPELERLGLGDARWRR